MFGSAAGAGSCGAVGRVSIFSSDGWMAPAADTVRTAALADTSGDFRVILCRVQKNGSYYDYSVNAA